MALIVPVPGSKSMTQRALVIAALAERPARVRGALSCDDTQHLTNVLRQLGTELIWERDQVSVVAHPLVGSGRPLWCGQGGTVLRFSCCLAAVAQGEIVLDGDARLGHRPIAGLLRALTQLGVTIRSLHTGVPVPLALRREWPAARELSVDGSQSSQFASGLLLVAPRLAEGLVLRLMGDLVSAPYVNMTLEMMRRAGAVVRWQGEGAIEVAPGSYFAAEAPAVIEVEPDWSSAAFILAAAQIAGVQVTIPGLAPPSESVQGDHAFLSILQQLRADGPHDIDLRDTPDLIAPLAALALFGSHPTRVRGVAHARTKESDRIAVLCEALRAVGAQVVEHPDGLDIMPLQRAGRAGVQLDPRGDHRMAMAFGLLGLRLPGIWIRNHQCVSKSFPGFFAALQSIQSSAPKAADA
jgi:3-phosphoshikimate 1-carboxyvinyltransferase